MILGKKDRELIDKLLKENKELEKLAFELAASRTESYKIYAKQVDLIRDLHKEVSDLELTIKLLERGD